MPVNVFSELVIFVYYWTELQPFFFFLPTLSPATLFIPHVSVSIFCFLSTVLIRTKIKGAISSRANETSLKCEFCEGDDFIRVCCESDTGFLFHALVIPVPSPVLWELPPQMFLCWETRVRAQIQGKAPGTVKDEEHKGQWRRCHLW